MTIINVPGALENLEPTQRDINPSLYTRCHCGTLTNYQTAGGAYRCVAHRPLPDGPECLSLDPDQAAIRDSICIDCGRPYVALLCLDDHNRRDRTEREGLRQTAYMAAEQMAHLRSEVEARERRIAEQDRRIAELEREIAALRAATDELPYLGAGQSMEASGWGRRFSR